MIGVCVEAVAAVAWLAELFPIPDKENWHSLTPKAVTLWAGSW